MPAETDPLALCPPEVRAEFESLFQDAKARGVVDVNARAHYAARFASDPYGLTRELEMTVSLTPGTPLDPEAYDASRLYPSERVAIDAGKAGRPLGTFGTGTSTSAWPTTS